MTRTVAIFVGCFVVLGALGGGAAAYVSRRAHTTIDAHAYDARGVVRSFGPQRAFVNIAHEDIPGYMKAMTMSFEPRTPTQLDGIAVGDAVVFRFTDTDDGRRLLDSIAKR